MKTTKYWWVFLVMVFLMAFCCVMTSCTLEGRNKFLSTDNTQIADETFRQFIRAIEDNDGSAIVSLFSPAAQSGQDNIEAEALRLFDFIKGDIVSYTSAEEAGVIADGKVHNGKTRKDIQPCFSIETTDSKYYVAIKECIMDEFDRNNVGVMSFYVIEAKNWHEDYIYGGDGAWTYGINIMEY